MIMERIKLGEICEIVSGSTPKTDITEYWDGNIDWITPAELTDETYIIRESQRKITHTAVQNTGLRPFPKDTVILSSRAPIGKVAIAGKEMYCNQGFKNLICSDRIDHRYLYWYLKGHTDYLNALGRGATFKEISKKIVENIEIPLPSLDEQMNCSNILKKCWDLILVHKEQIELYDKLVKARFVEMFGELEKSLRKVFLQDISEFIMVGIANSATHAYSDTGVVMLRNQNIKENYLDTADIVYIEKNFADKYKNKMLKKDDILITRTGYPGVACLVPKEYEGCQTFTTLIVRLKSSDLINPRYVCHFINSEYGKRYVDNMKVGVAQQNFGTKGLCKMPLFIPSREEQNEFIFFAQQVEKLKSTTKKSLAKLQTLQKSLMQQYFIQPK